MILNRSQLETEGKIPIESQGNSIIGGILAAVEVSPDPFAVEFPASGPEIHACAPVGNNSSNRARMKVVSPRAGRTLVFFFKTSQVPYSRDRYSYGGVELKTPHIEEEDLCEWLTFLSSGFHPEKRPARWRRAFPYEIPE
jgi:hypothetical protein